MCEEHSYGGNLPCPRCHADSIGWYKSPSVEERLSKLEECISQINIDLEHIKNAVTMTADLILKVAQGHIP
jgi:hypothetical protein